MLYVALAFWIGIGGAVFLIALGGGPGRARARLHSENALANRLRLFAFAVILAFGLAVPIAVAVANGHDKASQGPAGITLTKNETIGRQLFARSCATCHTLAAAAAVGHVGPDLDLDPQVYSGPASFVLNAIQLGRARGNGDMPAGIYTGQQAKDVAQFVVAVAGRK
ncbi:MAG TPA: cytochrome c [Solirubrobacteraceae bacterium]|nr:cytochrome c [Solirubrobacteraceae bacterium]